MFDNIGNKIKTLAEVLCWIGIVVSGLWGIVLLLNKMVVSGIVTIIVGSLTSWISSFVLYGFGELIDKVTVIADSTKGNVNNSELSLGNNNGIDSKVNSLKYSSVGNVGKCDLCGRTDVTVYTLRVDDGKNVRYRNVCINCPEAHKYYIEHE